MRHSRIVALAAVLATAALTAMLALQGAGGRDAGAVVRYEYESKYFKIRVVDYPDEGRRCLHFSRSRGVQSSMFLDDPVKLDLRYSKTMMAALALKPEAKDLLLVGLGGASIPKFIQKHFPDLRMDIVELDPDVVRVCQEYFAFKGTPNTRVVVMDGRMYFKRAEKKYDVILLDAYAADHIPFHLTTREFIALVKDRLKPGGLVASNLWEQAVNRFYYAELKTFQEAFPQVYLLPAGTSGNIIVFGSAETDPVSREEWVRRARAVARGRDLGFDLGDLVGEEYRYYTDRPNAEKALTDDMAPIDTMRREHPKFFPGTGPDSGQEEPAAP